MIGCGRIAQIAHLPAISRVDDVELAAVVDPSADLARRVAAQWGGIPHFVDLASAADAVHADAVILAVPDRLHAPLAEEALRSGLHVLVEKPIAGTVDDAIAMQRVAVESDRLLRVGNMRRHDPGVIAAKRHVGEDIGEILSFSAWYRPSVFDSDGFWRPIVTDAAVAGVEQRFKSDKDRYWPYTYGSHLWDTVRHLVGDVSAVTTEFYRTGQSATWQSIVRLTGGAVGTADLTCYEHGDGGEGIQVRGTRGTVSLSMHNPFSWRAADVSLHSDADRRVHSSSLTYADAYELQLRSFAAAVDGTADDVETWGRGATPDDGIAVVRLIEAMRDSVDSARAVEVR
jgi:predicted dehydrogenase